jgi:hypothetical protein
MIEQLVDRRKGAIELGEVDDPAKLGVELAADVERDLEAVAVQAAALVPFGHVRQPVGRLD